MENLNETSTFKRLHAAMLERKAWEAANDRAPMCACHGMTLTASWSAAILEDHHRAMAAERAEAEARASINIPSKLREAGVPELHIAGLGRKLESRTPLDAAQRWLGQPLPRAYPFLLLMGPTASGKTQAAVVAMAGFLRSYRWNEGATGTQGRRVAVFARAAEFNEVDAFSAQGRDWLSSLRECRLLVLDDMGTERLNDVVLSSLYGVLDARYGDMRPTVITSNLKVKQSKTTEPPQWAERYDERITRRIRELGMVAVGGKIRCGAEGSES